MRMNHSMIAFAAAASLAILASCGSSGGDTSLSTSPQSSAVPTAQYATGYQLLTPVSAQALLAKPPAGLVVLDVRTPAEFASGHLASAIDLNLQSASFAADVAKLDPAIPYFVYCHSGNRSAQAVAYLQQHGFLQIYELQGGISAWQTAGLPTVTG